jgi:hypothetical protein
MNIILTGPDGAVAYWNAAQNGRKTMAFGKLQAAALERKCSFARLSRFAANGNHAPTGAEGAITADFGLDLLYQIAGNR